MAVRLENDAADLVRVRVVCVTGDDARREAVVVVDARAVVESPQQPVGLFNNGPKASDLRRRSLVRANPIQDALILFAHLGRLTYFPQRQLMQTKAFESFGPSVDVAPIVVTDHVEAQSDQKPHICRIGDQVGVKVVTSTITQLHDFGAFDRIHGTSRNC